MSRALAPGLAVTLGVLLAFAAPTPRPQDVTIEVVPVRGNVSMLIGQGGNIGVSVGDDGAFLVDDQFAPLTERILAAVATISDEPVVFLVNTHWHGDHTGGNENMAAAGVTLVAHDNVRERLRKGQMSAFGQQVPPARPGALPRITYADGMTFHWNGDEVRLIHPAAAHTDGDTILHFVDADVFHMGDTFFKGVFPFIDPTSGGSLDGMIANAAHIMTLCDDDTLLMPGHGTLSTRDDLQAFHDMLVGVRDAMVPLVQQGLSKGEVIDADPTGPWNAEWGGGFLPPARFVGIVYDVLTRDA